MSKFVQTVQTGLNEIPAHKRPTKRKKAGLGIGMIVLAVVLKVLGWWDLIQIPMFVLGGHLVAGDYVLIAVRSTKASLKAWRNGDGV